MATTKELPVIEINEDAYKQNSVYRPWDETITSDTAAKAAIPSQALKALVALSQGLATASLPR